MREILAIYARISNEDCEKGCEQVNESFSLVHQRMLIQDYIRDHADLSEMVQIEFSDDGFTGTNFSRPKFQMMLGAVRRGEIQCIIVKDFSRLGRNFLEVSDYIDRVFPSLGVRLISIGDQYDSNDYSGMTAGMSIAFRNLIYDSYSKDLSMKVRSAMMTRMEKARYVNLPPYGYMKSESDKHQLIPDPETAPIVREVFARLISGQSTTEVAKELNRRRVPTPMQSKQSKRPPSIKELQPQWSRQIIIRIVQNPKYVGTMINHMKESRFLRDSTQRKTDRSEWFVRENAHEALVSREEFNLANQRLRRPTNYARNSDVVYDAVFRCGHCGRKLQKTMGTDPVYYCETPSYQEHAACAGMRWKRSELEAVLLPSYLAQLRLLGELESVADQFPGKSSKAELDRIARFEMDIEAGKAENLTIYEEYRSGKCDLDTYTRRKQTLSERIKVLEKEHEEAVRQYTSRRSEIERLGQIKERIREQLANGQLPEDRLLEQMYRSIDEVLVRNDRRIEIHWGFEDVFKQFRAVTLPEQSA